jgi:hypothetical protein
MNALGTRRLSNGKKYANTFSNCWQMQLLLHSIFQINSKPDAGNNIAVKKHIHKQVQIVENLPGQWSVYAQKID